MKAYTDKTVWFVTGSQTLYGDVVLRQVEENSSVIATGLTESPHISVKIINKGAVKSPEEIFAICSKANNSKECVGLILWMHTFSPAKMWINGLSILNKPYMHLHTQFCSELPWSKIDMHYMNVNQSAHGDREFGYIGTRMRHDRKVVVGHWQSENVQKNIDIWVRATIGWDESQHLKVARFGDNMRQVAVTEGDKVSAQIQFGYEVNAYSLGDLADVCSTISEHDLNEQIQIYQNEYNVSQDLITDEYQREILKNEARLELGIEKFLKMQNCNAFTNCFENLTGLTGLPGLATQRLMSKGYGYGAEGDWKTSAMNRIIKVMSRGNEGGTSFMEDYTYHFGGVGQVLGAHMLEICPSIAAEKPEIVIHKHTIGVNKDIARLLFIAKAGPALNVSTIDLGNRFRFVLNEVNTVTPPSELPNLPVAKALWEPLPSLEVAGAAWIYAGAAHHSVYTQGVTAEHIIDYAEIARVELVQINGDTTIPEIKRELKNNSVYYHLSSGV